MNTADSLDYEHARNLTLLFFFERLIDKNEPRTLHDLSCQFGAPGFTKEMRQIAGGSQSGMCISSIESYYLISTRVSYCRCRRKSQLLLHFCIYLSMTKKNIFLIIKTYRRDYQGLLLK